MTEKEQKNAQLQGQPSPKNGEPELDAAGKSLSEALRISFIILKVIMLVLVLVFLASGFRTIESGEKALVLRFGKIRGIGEERLLGPGLVGPLPLLGWVFPYPIDEIIKIPVSKKVNLPINSLWYQQTAQDLMPKGKQVNKPRIGPTLDPIRDGYCVTRSDDNERAFAGSDYSIVHSKWVLTYQIADPERFFRNVYVNLENLQAGQNYADIIAENIADLLRYSFTDAVVTAMPYYTIDEAMFEQVGSVTSHIKRLLQKKLDKIESGIKVVSVQLNDITWPRQVDEAFLDSIKASQSSQQAVSEARTYAENILNEAGGPIAFELLSAVNDESITEEEKQMLWSQLAGQAQGRLAEARAYQTKVVENAKANAEYLEQILPQYQEHPKLVIQKIYQDAMEYVLKNVDEKMIIQPTEGAKGREIRVMLNRDPSIKPKTGKK